MIRNFAGAAILVAAVFSPLQSKPKACSAELSGVRATVGERLARSGP